MELVMMKLYLSYSINYLLKFKLHGQLSPSSLGAINSMMSMELTADSSTSNPKKSSADSIYRRIKTASAQETSCARFRDANKELGQSPREDSTQKEPRLPHMSSQLSKKSCVAISPKSKQLNKSNRIKHKSLSQLQLFSHLFLLFPSKSQSRKQLD